MSSQTISLLYDQCTEFAYQPDIQPYLQPRGKRKVKMVVFVLWLCKINHTPQCTIGQYFITAILLSYDVYFKFA